MTEVKPYGDRSDRLDSFEEHESDLTPEQLASVVVQELGEVAGMRAVAVDGNLIRSSGIDIDFTQGGNPARYRYVPPDQLWVDVDLLAGGGGFGDAAATLCHAGVEFYEMRDAGASYDQGHEAANDHEFAFRQSLLWGVEKAERIEDVARLADDWVRKSGHYMERGAEEGVRSTFQGPVRSPEEEGEGGGLPGLGGWAEKVAG